MNTTAKIKTTPTTTPVNSTPLNSGTGTKIGNYQTNNINDVINSSIAKTTDNPTINSSVNSIQMNY